MKEKIIKGSVFIAAILGTITNLMIMSLHIYTFPDIKLVHRNEYLLLFLIIILYLFGSRYKMKAFNVIAILGIIIGIINLAGLRFISIF